MSVIRPFGPMNNRLGCQSNSRSCFSGLVFSLFVFVLLFGIIILVSKTTRRDVESIKKGTIYHNLISFVVDSVNRDLNSRQFPMDWTSGLLNNWTVRLFFLEHFWTYLLIM